MFLLNIMKDFAIIRAAWLWIWLQCDVWRFISGKEMIVHSLGQSRGHVDVRGTPRHPESTWAVCPIMFLLEFSEVQGPELETIELQC